MAVLLPSAAFDDLGHLRQIVHDIPPAGNLRAVFELRREHYPVIEPWITFQPIHRFPIFKGNLDQLGCDHILVAAKPGLKPPYVTRVLGLNNLAPDIVEAIVNGAEPDGLSIAQIMKNIPEDWNEQRKSFGFPER